MTHTPAPWKMYDYTFINAHHVHRIECAGLKGFGISTGNIEHKEAEANAQLIASAPDNTKDNFNAYAYLLRHMQMVHRNTAQGQFMLASMRSNLASAYGVDPQELESQAKESEDKFKLVYSVNADMLTRLQTNYDMLFKLYEMVNHHSNEEVLKQIRTELHETLELIKKAQGAN